jgi:PAS domain S-box-containing protein
MNVDWRNREAGGFEIENVFNSISDFVSVHDNEYRIIRANSALCTFLGRSEAELVGRKCYKVFHNRDSVWPGCPLIRMHKEKIPVREVVEDNFIGIPLLISCSPVHDENGRLTGAVHIGRDISRERAAEQDKDRTISELKEILNNIKGLHGVLTMCAACKGIRNDGGEWERIEKYLSEANGVIFSHGICPACSKKLYSYPDCS